MNYQPLGKVGTEEDIANGCFLVKDESSYISGQCLILDGGATIQEPWGLLYQYSQVSVMKNEFLSVNGSSISSIG